MHAHEIIAFVYMFNVCILARTFTPYTHMNANMYKALAVMTAYVGNLLLFTCCGAYITCTYECINYIHAFINACNVTSVHSRVRRQ